MSDRKTRYLATYDDALTAEASTTDAVVDVPAASASATDATCLSKDQIHISPTCSKVCQHLVRIDGEKQRGVVMTNNEIAMLLFKNKLHLPGPTQHAFWPHVSERLLLSSFNSPEEAIRNNRRYSKTSGKSSQKNANVVDKKQTEYRYRLAEMFQEQARELRTRGDEDQAIGYEKKADELIALSKEDDRRLARNSKAAEITRMNKKEQRSAAGSTATQLNQKNRKKFKVHDSQQRRGKSYEPTVQNVVSKAKIPFRVVIAVIRWLVKGKYIEQRFPAPSVNMHMPRATVTHYASGEIGCAGARSDAASLLAVYEYAAIMALQHNEELQVINFGIVNITASAAYSNMVNLKAYHEIYSHLEHQTSTLDRTVIDMHRGKEQIPAASVKRGVAINTCPTGRVCFVGIGSMQEFELAKQTIFRVGKDLATKHCRVEEEEEEDQRAEPSAKRQKLEPKTTPEPEPPAAEPSAKRRKIR